MLPGGNIVRDCFTRSSAIHFTLDVTFASEHSEKEARDFALPTHSYDGV